MMINMATKPFTATALPELTAQSPVLLSDDDLGSLQLTRMILETHGLTVLAARDPRDTILICRAMPISLVISDIHKPAMNGLEMLSILRDDPVTASIAFLFLSTCSNEAPRAFELGADGFLTKPFLRANLIDNVERILLDHGNWQSPDTLDPDLCAALTDPHDVQAAGPWYDIVWTTHRHDA